MSTRTHRPSAKPQKPPILKAFEKVALSDRDLTRLLSSEGIQCKITMYPELHRLQHLDELFGPTGCGIILYESRPRYGHWSAIIKGIGNDPNLVELFNSYGNDGGRTGPRSFGGWPDDPLRVLAERGGETDAFIRQAHEDQPYLSRLMLGSGYALSYNQYPLQKRGGDIRTCGRHAAARIMFRHLPLDHYVSMLRETSAQFGIDPDGVVTLLTSAVGQPGEAQR